MLPGNSAFCETMDRPFKMIQFNIQISNELSYETRQNEARNGVS